MGYPRPGRPRKAGNDCKHFCVSPTPSESAYFRRLAEKYGGYTAAFRVLLRFARLLRHDLRSGPFHVFMLAANMLEQDVLPKDELATFIREAVTEAMTLIDQAAALEPSLEVPPPRYLVAKSA